MNQGTSFRHLLWLLKLALLLPGITQGKEVVLGKAGQTVELPCKSSQKKNMGFTWKDSSEVTILGNSVGSLVTGSSKLKQRVETRKYLWDQGSFPLIIRKLEITDSGTYICEVGMNKAKTEVELLVFGWHANLDNTHLLNQNNIRLVAGESLNLTLEKPYNSNPSVEWKDPKNKKKIKSRILSLSQVGLQESGTWVCNVSQNKETLTFNINILVLAFQDTSRTFYTKVGESVVFLFPLTFEDEDLNGELKWQVEGASQPWISFSLENRKVSVEKNRQDREIQVMKTLPLNFSLPKALPQDAGSGELTLTLRRRPSHPLHQKVNLVVMRMTKSQDQLTCEVLGPSSPILTLSLKLNNQSAKVSNRQKQVKVQNPEVGVWQCLLNDNDKILVESKVEVLSSALTQDWTKLLAIVLGAVAGFLIFTGFCIFCGVKCWRRRRQAERMSQIKRLLSEKKTCQCPHRLQKTRNFI